MAKLFDGKGYMPKKYIEQAVGKDFEKNVRKARAESQKKSETKKSAK